jgi:glycosyltransferase involved in cell wall biosynthesis
MIDILLATYNGEKYLEEQLNSILNQTYQDFKITIRDDGSTDHTVAIIEKYQQKHPKQISFITDKKKNLGPAQNFMELFKYSKAEYIMLSDQDDVWLRDKIAITLSAMHEAEKNYPNKPLLIHTDLQIVNHHLQEIAPSYFRYKKFNSKNSATHQLIMQNIVTGCTIMINAKLRDKIKPNDCVIMHDHYLAIIASLFGKIICLNKTTMLYRQHANNVVGASPHNKYLISYLSKIKKFRNNLLLTCNQIKKVHEECTTELSPQQKEMLITIGKVEKYGFFRKIQTIIKYRLYESSFARNLILLSLKQ